MIKNYLIVCGGSGEQVLGQRSILGLDGEIQIDVSEEIRSTRHRLRVYNDPLSLDVPIDVCATNVAQLLSTVPVIARLQGWIGVEEKHAEFIRNEYISNPALVYAIPGDPIICGLATKHPRTQELFSSVISRMLHETAVGGDDLVFWIVSSTVGEAGEGIHRAVAKKICELTNQDNFRYIKIRNIRIGRETYRSTSHERGAIQTLLGICADAKLFETVRNQFQGNIPTINWYYMDFPDSGSGYEAEILRRKAISMAVKALMVPEISSRLDILESSSNTILIRTGHWNREYNDQDLFTFALSGFINQLENMINPDNDVLLNYQTKPEFHSGDRFEALLSGLKNIDKISEILETGWYLSGEPQPRSIEELDLYLNRSIRDVDALSHEITNYRDVQPQPIFTTEKFQNQTRLGAVQIGDWFEEYQNAQSLIAWVLDLLGIQDSVNTKNNKTKQTWFTEDGLLSRLLRKQKECVNAFKLRILKNSLHIAEKLSHSLSEYVNLLLRCRILVDEYIRAKKTIEFEQKPIKALEFAVNERNMLVQGYINNDLVMISNLYDIIDHLHHRTWFDLVFKTIQDKDNREFKTQILKGVIGLTETGLKEALGLPPISDVEDIIKELVINIGRAYDYNGNKINSIWMNNQEPFQQNINGYFNYRLLPRLKSKIENFPTNEYSNEIAFRHPPLGMLGLNVVAIEGLTIANGNNFISTPSFLIEPLVPQIKQLLTDWQPHRRGTDSARMQVAVAGVIGDPLSLEVLQDAGLSDEEITKLSEYYVISKFE